MKILLINPPNSAPINSGYAFNVFQPLGLAYIAAVLEENNYPVKILDALTAGFNEISVKNGIKTVGLKDREIKKYIKKFQPDIVGVATPFSFQVQETHRIINLVKKLNPKITTVVGGAHPTIQPEDMLKNKNIDYVVRGEGEFVMLDLVKTLEQKKSVVSIESLSYRYKGKIINNPRSEPISNLDNLPMPSRHLLPMDRYFEAAKIGRVPEGLIAFGKKRTSIITSRGCPFTCTFCSVHLTMTRKWRGRSPENVVAEIKDFVNKYQIEYFDIFDDNFTLLPDRAKKICHLLIKENLNLRWSTPNGIRADRVDEELIRLMKQAGCIGVKVAPESGNQEILSKVIKKNLNLEKVKEVVSLCKKYALPVEAFFVIGFPEEKESDIWDTINYAKGLLKLGCDYCYFFIATPYFGTEMFDNAVKNGFLNKRAYQIDTIFTAMNKSILKSPHIKAERLSQLLQIAGRINPPVTKNRLFAGLSLLLLDPVRILKYLFNYIKRYTY